MRGIETIVALATPIGKGALALIRLSGEHVRKITDNCSTLKSKKNIVEVPTHTIHYGTINEHDGKIIDSVLFFIMDGPRSFTGENSIEITCHNNPFIIKKIIEKFIEQGAKKALPGEFTERAVLNKKIDILQAEAINDLLSAQSELETQLALGQVEGTLSAAINQIDDQISTIAAWCQASFEFLDEERDFRINILNQVITVNESVNALLEQHSFYNLIKEGIKIGIVGNTNVGKSSLLNKIIKQQKAIVTDIPGTTRDIVEGIVHQDGMYWTFIDTAGIRMTKDIIEQAGIAKSHQIAEKADIILLVFTEEEAKTTANKELYGSILKKYANKIIMLKNKIDTESKITKKEDFLNHEYLEISAKFGHGIDLVLSAIKEKKNYLLGNQKISYLINLRHVEALNYTHEKLKEIKTLLEKEETLYEIALAKLHEIQEKLTLMSGKTIQEKSFDKVFRSFCVGK